MSKNKGQSFEDEVIELAITDDEFVNQFLDICRRRMLGEITDRDQLAREIDAIHDSATVSLSQRYDSHEEHENAYGDDLLAMERDGKAS